MLASIFLKKEEKAFDAGTITFVIPLDIPIPLTGNYSR
jgi:hypothetical protein